MKLLRFMAFGKEGWAFQNPVTGSWHGKTQLSSDFPGTLDDLIARGRTAIDAAVEGEMSDAPVLDLASIELLAPVGKPPKIICVGLNYRDHTAESGFQQPDYPTMFSRFNTSVIAHGAPLMHTHLSDTLDFEGELVLVIGKGGRNIRKDDALAHVLAYSIFNDASVRAYQFKSPQWMMGKNFDGTGAFGPWMVTADELPPGARGLMLETRLNGKTVQSANTNDMVFDIETLIATISEGITLEPGDLIVTGTPSGIGHARTPPLYMKPGDVCEVQIDGIGLLHNPVRSFSESAGATQ